MVSDHILHPQGHDGGAASILLLVFEVEVLFFADWIHSVHDALVDVIDIETWHFYQKIWVRE